MTPFETLTAVAAPLMRPNIDTDVIIPSREMKTVSKTGLKDGLFANWRYSDPAERRPDPRFVLNREAYQDAQILLAGDNFGCGSSREHAVWALAEYGFRVVVAPSFGAIFEKNSVMNGLVPARLDEAIVMQLISALDSSPDKKLTVDLGRQRITARGGIDVPFSINEGYRAMLLNGWDAVTLTLKHGSAITEWKTEAQQRWPWINAVLKT